jgi:hypothetical protein
VTPHELRDALAELAREAGMDVRVLRPAGEPDAGPRAASGVCRVRGRLWVVLAAADSREDHIGVLAEALRAHAGEWLEGRWLPPRSSRAARARPPRGLTPPRPGPSFGAFEGNRTVRSPSTQSSGEPSGGRPGTRTPPHRSPRTRSDPMADRDGGADR